MQVPEQPLYFVSIFSIWIVSPLEKADFTLKLRNLFLIRELNHHQRYFLKKKNPEIFCILQLSRKITEIEVSLLVLSKLISIHEKAPG